jgi:hypothetical protein
MSLMVLPHLTHQPSPAGRVGHISLVFREMWDTTALDAQLRWLSLERRSHRPALPQSNETHLGPATTPYRTATLSLSSRPERSGAEGPAVPRTLHGNVFRTAPTCPGVPWRNLQLPKEPPKLHANQGEGNSMSETRNTHHD